MPGSASGLPRLIRGKFIRGMSFIAGEPDTGEPHEDNFASLIWRDCWRRRPPSRPARGPRLPREAGPDHRGLVGRQHATVGLRFAAEELTKLWGQQIVVVNRPGAGAGVAARAAADAAPDGYTLYQPVLSTFVFAASGGGQCSSKVPRDFLLMGFVAENPMLLSRCRRRSASSRWPS